MPFEVWYQDHTGREILRSTVDSSSFDGSFEDPELSGLGFVSKIRRILCDQPFRVDLYSDRRPDGIEKITADARFGILNPFRESGEVGYSKNDFSVKLGRGRLIVRYKR